MPILKNIKLPKYENYNKGFISAKVFFGLSFQECDQLFIEHNQYTNTTPQELSSTIVGFLSDKGYSITKLARKGK